MGPLRFGHPEDKAAAAAFNRRQRSRERLRDNVVTYYTKYKPMEEWPTVNTPHCFFPKFFSRLPLSVLQDAGAVLQALKLYHESRPKPPL